MGQRTLHEYLEGTALGTTADAYAVALSLDTRSFINCTIIIKNTHATNVMTYKIDGFANYAGANSIADVAGTDIVGTASATFERVTTKCRGRIDISVKSKVASTPATYTIEYIQN